MTVDMNGKKFKVGQQVAKAYHTGDLRITTVTKIKRSKLPFVEDLVYLGKSTNPLRYPESVLILPEKKKATKKKA